MEVVMKQLLTIVIFFFLLIATGCGGGGGVDEEALLLALGNAVDSLQDGDFSLAHTFYNAALLIDPDNADANVGWAITKLALEADDVLLFINPDADTLFRKTSSFLLPVNIALQMPGKFTGVTSPAMSFGLDYNREANADEKSADQLQDEMERVKPILESTISSLKKGQTRINGSGNRDTWHMRIPKDVNDLPAGFYKFDYGDLLLLIGGLEMGRALGDFFISVNVTGVEDFENIDWYNAVDLDVDDNDIVTPEEYFPMGQAMTLRTGYGSTMRNVDDLLSSGAGFIQDGIAVTLAESVDDDELLPVNTDTELREEVIEIQSHLGDFFDSLTDAGVTLNIADYDEYADSIPFTFSLKHLFDPAINNWRDIAPNLIIPELYDYAEMPETVGEAFDDPTMNGIFPGGISQELYDVAFEDFEFPGW